MREDRIGRHTAVRARLSIADLGEECLRIRLPREVDELGEELLLQGMAGEGRAGGQFLSGLLRHVADRNRLGHGISVSAMHAFCNSWAANPYEIARPRPNTLPDNVCVGSPPSPANSPFTIT